MVIQQADMSSCARHCALLAAVVIVVIVVVRCQIRIAGPFRVVPGHVEDCPSMKPKRAYYRLYYKAVRDRKHQDIWFFSGNLTSFITLDDNYTATGNLASWSSRGGWKDNAFQKVLTPMCSASIALNPIGWRLAMKTLFNDPNKKCPIPPDTVSITNFSSNYDFTFPPAFFYGKYRATGWLNNTQTGDLIICKRAYFEVLPKLAKSGVGR